jgi:hypothetical protein
MQFTPGATVSQDYTHCVAPVHGTFDPHPDWYVEGSAFYQAFAEELLPKRFSFFPMHWSAGNTFRSRYAGALMLRRNIKKRLRIVERLYLVSHSHGGNVAVRATSTPSLSYVPHVTIGTPFIRLEKESRIIGAIDIAYATLFWYAGLFPWALHLVGSAGTRFIDPWFDSLNGIIRVLVGIGLFPLFFLCISTFTLTGLALYFRIRYFLINIETNKRDRSTRSLINFAPPANRMLCIYTKLDEAFWALKASTSVLGGLNYAVILSMILLVGGLFFASREFKLHTIWMFFGDFGVQGALTKVPACIVCEPEESEVVTALFFFLPASAVFLPVLLARLALKLILFRFVFGMFDLPTALRTNIVVTRTPWKHVGEVDAVCVQLSNRSWSRFRLRHTELARDKAIARKIMHWIEHDSCTVASRRASPATESVK